MKWIRPLICVLCLLLCSSWNKQGHQVSGVIAFQYLKEKNPAVITKVVTLMTAHPEFNTRWKSEYDALTGDDKNIFLFMKAAEWPDIIKEDNPNDYPVDRSSHYINWPVKFEPTVHTVPPDAINSLKQLNAKIAVLKSNKTKAEKAMALCWVFHLLGDMHQPLHNVALFGEGFPAEGDHGGNNFFIKKTAAGTTTNLHSLWDGVVITSSSFKSIKDKGTEIKSSQHVTYDPTIKLEYEKWSKDFVKIAEANVYKFNGNLIHSGTKDSGKLLPTGYMKNAEAVAKTQLTEAGMRLAVVLSKTL